MSRFTIQLLGAPRVTVAGHPLDLRVRKELALLAYLAVESERPQRRDHLLGLLWPDLPEEDARNNLRVALARLRRALGDTADALQIDRQQAQFVPPSDASVDVLAFRAPLSAAAAHAHSAIETCDACVARLAEAAAHYGGEFLAGFSLPDSAPFEEWATIQRERLHQQQLDALDTLARAAERRGDHAGQCACARRQLALEPWRESAHAQLIRGLWASGQRGAALEQFESCRRILADELGLPPSAELAALVERLRAGDAPPIRMTAPADPPPAVRAQPAQSYPDIPTTPRLYGRDAALTQLQRWLVDDRCRLIGLLGIGGVGKTTLAAASAAGVAGQFDAVVWRSLVNAPPLDELLRDVLGELTPGAVVELPADAAGQIGLLLAALRGTRCLLVLDNLESILQHDQPGVMRPGYEGYTQLLRHVAERAHQSCVLLTSRERPQGLARLEEDTPLVRLLRLDGLDPAAGAALLTARGLRETDGAAGTLAQRYSGNPLALRLVAQTVREVFDGDIGAFLATDAAIFDDISVVLDQQLERLTPLEQELLVWLAVLREPTPVTALRGYLVRPASPSAVLEAARALLRRSLIAQGGGGLMLQNVVTEYLTERLISAMLAELSGGELDWLHRFALLTTDVPEYVRQSQLRLIVEPVARQLAATDGITGVATLARRLLDSLRAIKPRYPSYAAGNLLNLLTQLQIDIQGYDFSDLCVWQADMRQVTAFDVSFAGADLSHAVFSDRFDAVNRVAFSPDGTLVAACSSNGVVGAWRVADGQRHALFIGHHVAVKGVAFSPDGRVLASAGHDATARLWDVASGAPMRVLEGHSMELVAAAWVPGASLLVTSSADDTLRLWETRDGSCIRVIQVHGGGAHALAVDPAGALVAAANSNGGVHLWRLPEGELTRTLAHPQAAHSAAFSPDGRLLVTGCTDFIARVWDTRDGRLVRQLEGHGQLIDAVCWSPDGRTIATGSMDTTIRLWDAGSGETLRVLRGHNGNVGGLDWSPDGALLASAGNDETIRLWSTSSGETLRVLRGNAAGVLSLTFGRDSATLYSTQGWMVREWDVTRRHRRRVLRGHRDVTTSVSASRDGLYLASASRDGTARVWDTAHGRALHVLDGHTSIVQAVALRPDGHLLASGCYDTFVRLWDVHSGQLVRILSGHTGWIEALAFSADGTLLFSGGADGTMRLWDVHSGHELWCAEAPNRTVVRSVAFSPDGALLAATSNVGMLVLDRWSGECVQVLAPGKNIICLAWSPDGTQLATGSTDWAIWLWQRSDWTTRRIGYHATWISAVAWSPDGALLASCSVVGEISLWDGRSGTRVCELRDDGPYAGMDITGVAGLTPAQRASLVALGAIDGGRSTS